MIPRSKEKRERELKLELAYCRKDVTALVRKMIGDRDHGQLARTMMIADSTFEDKLRLGRFRADEILFLADICGKTVVIAEKHPDLLR